MKKEKYAKVFVTPTEAELKKRNPQSASNPERSSARRRLLDAGFAFGMEPGRNPSKQVAQEPGAFSPFSSPPRKPGMRPKKDPGASPHFRSFGTILRLSRIIRKNGGGGTDLIEMRGGKDLKYSNQLPSWAKAFHFIVMVFVALISLGFWALGIYMFTERDGWILSIVLFLCGGVTAWLTLFIKRINHFYNHFLVITELREDGYYTSITNKKTSKVEESFIPFQQMREILIGRTARYVSTGGNTPGYYIAGARIIMQWEDEKGAIRYATFGEENQEGLDQWIGMFAAKQLPIFTTQHHIGALGIPDLQDGYAEIPKEPYDNSNPSFQTGYLIQKAIPEWKSASMQAKESEQLTRNDKKIFRPIYAGTMVFNLLIAFFWMPVWPLEEESIFAESPSMLISFLNMVLLFLGGTYWRKKVKWYRSLLDVFLLIIVQLIGVYASRAYRTTPLDYLDAVVVEGLTLGFILCGIFAVVRLVRRSR